MRIFIAIRLNNHIKSHLNGMAKQLSQHFSKARFTSPENYHITLKFIGEVDRTGFNKTVQAVKKAVREIDRFSISTREPGSFKKGNKRIFYCSVENSTELRNLYESVCSQLEEAGVESNPGKFNPHITLAREVIVNEINPRTDFGKKIIKVEAISVMESTRVNKKLTYIPQYIAKLRSNHNG